MNIANDSWWDRPTPGEIAYANEAMVVVKALDDMCEGLSEQAPNYLILRFVRLDFLDIMYHQGFAEYSPLMRYDGLRWYDPLLNKQRMMGASAWAEYLYPNRAEQQKAAIDVLARLWTIPDTDRATAQHASIWINLIKRLPDIPYIPRIGTPAMVAARTAACHPPAWMNIPDESWESLRGAWGSYSHMVHRPTGHFAGIAKKLGKSFPKAVKNIAQKQEVDIVYSGCIAVLTLHYLLHLATVIDNLLNSLNKKDRELGIKAYKALTTFIVRITARVIHHVPTDVQ